MGKKAPVIGITATYAVEPSQCAPNSVVVDMITSRGDHRPTSAVLAAGTARHPNRSTVCHQAHTAPSNATQACMGGGSRRYDAPVSGRTGCRLPRAQGWRVWLWIGRSHDHRPADVARL
jgi:hypothetical protein